MKQISSVTTTMLEEQLSKIGMPRGEPGLEMQEGSREIADWLAGQDPRSIDKLAALRAQQYGVELAVIYQGRYPSGPNGERLPSYNVAVGCEIGGDNESRVKALVDIENFMMPARRDQIEEWIAELSVISASRRSVAFEDDLRLEAYTSRLRQYPADVVHNVLIERSWKWWPTWVELEDVCEATVSPRRNMIAALKRPSEDAKEVPAPRMTKEAHASLMAEYYRRDNQCEVSDAG